MDPKRIVVVGHDPIIKGSTPPDHQTLAAFGLADREPVALPGGEGRTYRVGNAILKHLHRDLAHVVRWNADLHASIHEDGFRVSRPLPTREGDWLTDDAWPAWTLLEGDHDFRQHIKACITAIERYHAALKAWPRPAFMDTRDNHWVRADRHAFGDRPAQVHPDLEAQVDALYALRKPLVGLPDQLIHGDLNGGNILLAADQPPAIIDIAPYWRPASFALAVFAYWVGPWWDRAGRLGHFAGVEQFDQLLIRAGIRMLLSMSERGRVEDLERYTRATELIVARIRR